MKAEKIKRKTLTCKVFPKAHNHSTISKRYKETCKKFGVKLSKVILGVSDAGSDVKKAHKDDLKVPWWHCIAHRFKNAADEAIKNTPAFKKLRKKVSRVVQFIKKSNNGFFR